MAQASSAAAPPLAMPALSVSVHPDREAHGRATLLETLLESFRRLLVTLSTSPFYDVLRHVCVEVCLAVNMPTFSVAGSAPGRAEPHREGPNTSFRGSFLPTFRPTLATASTRILGTFSIN